MSVRGPGVVSAELVAAGCALVLTDVADWRAPRAGGLPFVRADAALDIAERWGLRPAPVTGPSQDEADDCLAGLGLTTSAVFEFGADVRVTPREVLTAALGNPFRWTPGQHLRTVPEVVAEVLAGTGAGPDEAVLPDRTVRYRS